LITRYPNLFDGYFVRIQIFMRLQKWEEALHDIEILKLLKKDNIKIKIMECKCQEKKKNFSSCIKILNYLIEEFEGQDFKYLKKCNIFISWFV
jgi:hypothetical protein